MGHVAEGVAHVAFGWLWKTRILSEDIKRSLKVAACNEQQNKWDFTNWWSMTQYDSHVLHAESGIHQSLASFIVLLTVKSAWWHSVSCCACKPVELYEKN